MTEGEAAAREINDPKNNGDVLQISNVSTLSVHSSGTDLDHEVLSPPLAIISSRVKSAGALVSCANYETATVKYSYETTSLGRLLKMVGEKMKGRKALSVALLVHGSPGCFKLCSQKVREGGGRITLSRRGVRA